MKLYEFQTKQLFAQYGIPVPSSYLIKHMDELNNHINNLEGSKWVVKAQVYAGGRGKGGGIKLAASLGEVQELVSSMLGSVLHTPQTDANGLPVNHVLIEAASEIDREYYVGLALDRSIERMVMMVSSAGGMDIETVAVQHPEKLFKTTIDPLTGFNPYQGRLLGYRLGLAPHLIKPFSDILLALHRIANEKDASLVEINPLVLTRSGKLLALDAKFVMDDNAAFRQADLFALHDHRQENPKEMEAKQHDLNYVAMQGNIGCLVNGAGLAMATMDLIKVHGGEPANFLDVGGTATADRVAHAFKIILSDHHVKAVLVNIFGGIVRCNLIAEGILQAAMEVSVKIPIIVRLEGTNAELGRVALKNKLPNIMAAESLTDAAQKAVAASRGG